MLAVFLDIKGAFDNITFSAIIDAMKTKAIGPSVIAWYSLMLSNRTANYTDSIKPIIIHLTRGIPQGGILSPLVVWNLAMDKLLNRQSRNIHLTAFADDLVIVASVWILDS